MGSSRSRLARLVGSGWLTASVACSAYPGGTGGDWNTAVDWNPGTGAPVTAGDVAVFGNTVTGTANVTFSGPAAVGQIQFTGLTGTAAYTIGTGSATFSLDNGGGPVIISTAAGMTTSGTQTVQDGISVAGSALLQADINSGTVKLAG